MPVHDAFYYAALHWGAIMPTGAVLSASAGGSGDVVLGTPVAGAVYQVTASVGAYLHIGGPATSGADYYLAAGAPVTLVLCNEDVVAPNLPTAHAYMTGAGTVCAAQMSLPNLQARSAGLGFSEAGVAVDQPTAAGGRQTATPGVEAQGAPADALASTKNSP